MDTITNSLKEVLYDTWPMIVLTCVVLISITELFCAINKGQIIV